MRLYLFLWKIIMKLIGSTTSPFARRIRIWALKNNADIQFENLDIFSPADRQVMINNNPARKIPILVDNQHTITDSNTIIRYLLNKNKLPSLSWQHENLLTTINACNDSLVEVLLCQRSGFDTHSDKLFFNLQNERIVETLSYLNNHLTDNEFNSCEYLSISLYCLLDWIYFRELIDLTPFNKLIEFHQAYNLQEVAKQTDPRI